MDEMSTETNANATTEDRGHPAVLVVCAALFFGVVNGSAIWVVLPEIGANLDIAAGGPVLGTQRLLARLRGRNPVLRATRLAFRRAAVVLDRPWGVRRRVGAFCDGDRARNIARGSHDSGHRRGRRPRPGHDARQPRLPGRATWVCARHRQRHDGRWRCSRSSGSRDHL